MMLEKKKERKKLNVPQYTLYLNANIIIEGLNMSVHTVAQLEINLCACHLKITYTYRTLSKSLCNTGESESPCKNANRVL